MSGVNDVKTYSQTIVTGLRPLNFVKENGDDYISVGAQKMLLDALIGIIEGESVKTPVARKSFTKAMLFKKSSKQSLQTNQETRKSNSELSRYLNDLLYSPGFLVGLDNGDSAITIANNDGTPVFKVDEAKARSILMAYMEQGRANEIIAAILVYLRSPRGHVEKIQSADKITVKTKAYIVGERALREDGSPAVSDSKTKAQEMLEANATDRRIEQAFKLMSDETKQQRFDDVVFQLLTVSKDAATVLRNALNEKLAQDLHVTDFGIDAKGFDIVYFQLSLPKKPTLEYEKAYSQMFLGLIKLLTERKLLMATSEIGSGDRGRLVNLYLLSEPGAFSISRAECFNNQNINAFIKRAVELHKDLLAENLPAKDLETLQHLFAELRISFNIAVPVTVAIPGVDNMFPVSFELFSNSKIIEAALDAVKEHITIDKDGIWLKKGYEIRCSSFKDLLSKAIDAYPELICSKLSAQQWGKLLVMFDKPEEYNLYYKKASSKLDKASIGNALPAHPARNVEPDDEIPPGRRRGSSLSPRGRYPSV